MDFKQPWVIALAAVAAIAITAAVVRLVLQREAKDRVPVANSDPLWQLPEFTAALSRHRARVALFAVSALALAAVTAYGTGRPQATVIESPEQRNRDIMLCLDVSGSMARADAAITKTFRQLVTGFEGERIGLVIFDGTAVSVFPLTDDYQFTLEQLAQAQAVFEGDANPMTFYEGVNNSVGTSLIGDGLASCVQSFDQLDANRARSIILATDNQVVGKPLFSLREAGEYAKAKSVRVYAVNPADTGADQESAELRRVVEGTAGAYYPLADPAATAGIIGQVQSQEATLIKSAARRFRSDDPRGLIAMSGIALLGLLAAGRRWRR